jgi:hypothetical protein
MAPVIFVCTKLKGELLDNSDDEICCRAIDRTLREYRTYSRCCCRCLNEQ